MNLIREKKLDKRVEEIMESVKNYKKESLTEKELKGVIKANLIKGENK